MARFYLQCFISTVASVMKARSMHQRNYLANNVLLAMMHVHTHVNANMV